MDGSVIKVYIKAVLNCFSLNEIYVKKIEDIRFSICYIETNTRVICSSFIETNKRIENRQYPLIVMD